jgi:hypothetical protein
MARWRSGLTHYPFTVAYARFESGTGHQKKKEKFMEEKSIGREALLNVVKKELSALIQDYQIFKEKEPESDEVIEMSLYLQELDFIITTLEDEILRIAIPRLKKGE